MFKQDSKKMRIFFTAVHKIMCVNTSPTFLVISRESFSGKSRLATPLVTVFRLSLWLQLLWSSASSGK